MKIQFFLEHLCRDRNRFSSLTHSPTKENHYRLVQMLCFCVNYLISVLSFSQKHDICQTLRLNQVKHVELNRFSAAAMNQTSSEGMKR